MDTRRIGSLEVSTVGVGCNNFGWRIDLERTREVIQAAQDEGINFFDTADVYGEGLSEEYLGRALEGRRDEVFIATKFGMPFGNEPGGAKAEYVRHAAESSLRRLRTDRLDLVQLHRPDPTIPIAETLAALDDLVREGKVREIGCSNFSPEQIRAAQAAVRPGAARFVSVQNEYSLLHRDAEKEVLPECARLGLCFLPYFPLASGLLSGKYRHGEPPPAGTRLANSARLADRYLTAENMRIVDSLEAFARARGHTLLELAFAWLLAKPVVSSVIAGATSAAQVRANASAAAWRLGPEDLAEVGYLREEF